MPSPLVRRSLWAIAIAALAVALAIAFVPFLASTRIVRDRIAYELGSWSGYRVSIGAAPEIEVWPGLRASVNNVTSGQPKAISAGPPIVSPCPYRVTAPVRIEMMENEIAKFENPPIVRKSSCA